MSERSNWQVLDRLGNRHGDLDRGSVTAELALGLPVIAMLLGVLLAVAAVASAQLRCIDAARSGARLAARREPAGIVVAAARRVGPSGARVTVAQSPAQVSVTVSATVALPLPGHPTVGVGSRSVADREPADAVG